MNAMRCALCTRTVRETRARQPQLRWVNHAVACSARGELPRGVARAEGAVAWDLRAAWAGGWDVGVLLKDGRRIRCRVERVAATGAFAIVWDGRGSLHVPLVRVVSVARPHFHAPEWGAPVAPMPLAQPPPVFQMPSGQLALDMSDGRPDGWVDPRVVLQQGRGRTVHDALRLRGLSFGGLTDEQKRRAASAPPGLVGRSLAKFIVDGKRLAEQIKEADAARASARTRRRR